MIARFLLLLVAVQAFAAPAEKLKLIVGIVIDQFRYDYLTRFGADYHGGLHQLLTQGANFTNAYYAQMPTVTAVGHSIFLSGAMPAVSGMVNNAWYDRQEGKVVTSVCDWNEQVVGGAQPDKGARCTDSDPASPRRLLVSTVGDELRIVHPESKVIGISIKARASILPSGHRAAGAYWFDDATGHFVSSTFYMQKLPSWASAFNQENLPAKYVGEKWEGFPSWEFHASPGSGLPYEALAASPWGNELIEQFAERAITGEQLGQRGETDLLTVSFSSNDYVGHRVGPDAPEVHDMSIRTDQLLAKLFRLIDQKVGLKNTVIVLSADHGVARLPEQDEADKMPGGRVLVDLEDTVQSALTRKFGTATWIIPGGGETVIYFDWAAISKVRTAEGKPVSEQDVYAAAREAIFSIPQLHAARVYTRRQLENGITGDFIAQAAVNGFYAPRGADIAVILQPGYVPSTSGTTHFSPYKYDTHVPVLFMGPGIKPGHYDGTIKPNDIAPTLATMLDIQTPNGSSGRVLTEMLER